MLGTRVIERLTSAAVHQCVSQIHGLENCLSYMGLCKTEGECMFHGNNKKTKRMFIIGGQNVIRNAKY